MHRFVLKSIFYKSINLFYLHFNKKHWSELYFGDCVVVLDDN
jgi:hypothetical protein